MEKLSWGLWGGAVRRRVWGRGRWGLGTSGEMKEEGRGEAWGQVGACLGSGVARRVGLGQASWG